MKRKLIRQMLNEWRTNIWLAIELLLVSVVMWFLADQLWAAWATYNEPLGFDISHCYKLSVVELNENSPDYTDYGDDNDAKIADRLALVDRLKARPEIEAVAMGTNAYFYNPSNSMVKMDIDSLNGFFLIRRVTPDFFRVFRIHGARGETPEQMAEILEKSPWNSFMADNDLYKVKFGVESLDKYVGRNFHQGSDSTDWTLTKLIPSLRYSDFLSAYDAPSIIKPLPGWDISWANETVVRVRENMDKDFATNLMNDAATGLRVGNWYIQSVQSFDGIRERYNLHYVQNVQRMVIWSVFLLVNIFLGILGTFWFRTSQRTKEIALRMANGATRSDAFRRILSEGELILIAVTPLSLIISYMLTQFGLNTLYWGTFFEPVRFFGCALITFALISLMIVVGSWMPARKAMSISPAVALKTE